MFTIEQIAALKSIIYRSKDGNELAKQVMAFLIDSSEGLTKEVYLSLIPNRGYDASEIIDASHGIHDMESENCSTHINTILCAMGSELNFDGLSGDPAISYDRDDKSYKGFSFFLMNASRQPMRLVATREILDSLKAPVR